MSEYTVVTGDTFELISRKRYGVETNADLIKSANPDAVEPLTPGIAGFVYSRSGLGAMQGLTVAQGVGVIDPDYRGEITVVLLNTSGEERRLRRGDRIAQLVFQPALQVELEECETLGATGRGSGGFGHTGKH